MRGKGKRRQAHRSLTKNPADDACFLPFFAQAREGALFDIVSANTFDLILRRREAASRRMGSNDGLPIPGLPGDRH
jgi:hypothetical protein